MSYTQVFGGSTIYPSDVSYAALSLTADTTTLWPLEANTGVPVIARIMDVTPTGAYSISMPNATKTSPGQTVLFNNLGPSTITIKSFTGVTLASIDSGEAWQIYLTDVSTSSGSWRTFQMGSLTSQAQASALAGYGTVATGSTLSASEPVTTFNSDYTMGSADRGSAYIWTGALGTVTLTSVSSLGNNWFADVRNSGSGNLTIDPSAAETINGEATLVLTPGDSCRLVNDGTSWYTIGFGQDATFAFDYTLITLPSTGVATYTLSGSELNRIAYKFTGTLTANIKIIMPNTTQQYWVDNSTTGGSYTLSIATVAQASPVGVNRGSRGIYYCDGTDVVNAATAGLASPISILDGGTGATTAGAALINLGGTSAGIGVFTAATEALARTAILAAKSGANSDITSLSGLTTALSIAQGGTGAITAPLARAALSAAASGANSDITSLSALSTPLSVAQGGIGVATVTGVLKGNGTSAISAATAGTDFVAPATATTFTAKQTFQGSSTTPGIKIQNALEKVTISATAATGTINYDCLTQSVLYYTSSAAANWTLNLRGDGTTSLDTLMATGESITVVFMVTNGATPYYQSALTIDGGAVTPKWQGGTAPAAGNASSIDSYSLTVVKTGAGAFTAFESITKFA